MCKFHDGYCLEDVLGSPMFADGGWSRTAAQTRCPDHAVRVGLCPQPAGWDRGSWVLSLTSEGMHRHRQIDRASWYHHVSALFRPDSIGNYPQLEAGC